MATSALSVHVTPIFWLLTFQVLQKCRNYNSFNIHVPLLVISSMSIQSFLPLVHCHCSLVFLDVEVMLPFQLYPASPLPAVYWLLQTSLGFHVSSLLTVSNPLSPRSTLCFILAVSESTAVCWHLIATEKKGILSKTMFKVLPVQKV